MDRPIIENSDNRILIQAPGRAENDAMVPVLIVLDAHTLPAADPFEKVYLVVDVNPAPLGDYSGYRIIALWISSKQVSESMPITLSGQLERLPVENYIWQNNGLNPRARGVQHDPDWILGL